MNVSTLIERLSMFPQHLDVYLADRTTDFAFGQLDEISMKSIPFTEEPGGKALARETVIILGELDSVEEE